VDHTLVALFSEPQEANCVRTELLNAGFDDNDVSIFSEIAPKPDENLLDPIVSLLGKPPRHAAPSFLTIYTAGALLEKAEAIIEKHHPLDVKWA
jgi:hypothetical protein